MPVTLVINLSKWPSGNLRCHPCTRLFHRRVEAHFKVQLTESLSNLTFSKRSLLWSIPVKLAMIRDLYGINLAASSFFKAEKKHTNIFLLQMKILWRSNNLHRNCILSIIRILVNQDQCLSCASIALNLGVQQALFSNHQESLKELHRFSDSWIPPNTSHFRVKAKGTTEELPEAHVVYMCLNYYRK